MDITGKIIEIQDTQNINDSFQKREFVLEYAENPLYPEYVKFELIQERCALVDAFKVGDEVKVQFNLKGRKWTDKEGQVRYFNSLQAWKIDSLAGQSSQDAPPAPNNPPAPPANEDDVLPF
ncbi:MAG: DUF3127 domain-containing protein [Cyclobacteriaceae bacterium]|nr:DUF3127 domain-containing protein [Cyclobacteriaceae bacterium]